MTTTLTLKRPDDWHLHLRDGGMLSAVAPDSAAHFGRGLIMPNLVPPVVTGADATAYRNRIMDALPNGHAFTPMMTLYLTETTDPADVAAAALVAVLPVRSGRTNEPLAYVCGYLAYLLELEEVMVA